MALSFRKSTFPRYLVNNPIRFGLLADSDAPVTMEVSTGGDVVYKGVYNPVLNSPYINYKVDISVEDIVKPYMRPADAGALVNVICLSDFDYLSISVKFTQGNSILNYSGNIYNGGIGKRLFRQLYIHNTDIFSYKFTDTSKQFFLTTRTSGRHITMKENEICPLFFVATDKTYSVVTEYGNTFILPEMTVNRLYALSIDAIRGYSDLLYNKMPSFFGIMIDGQYVFDVTVTQPVPAPDKYIIEFRNSFGVYERLEVSGRCLSEPEFGENNAFDRYDVTVDDFIEKNERLSVREVINAEFGYKTPDEFLFARDMLQSDDRRLIDPSGNYHQVRVLSENFSHELHPKQPGSVPLKIRFVDTDTSYSPEQDDSPPDFYFGEPIWLHGVMNGYGFLFADEPLNTI
jgi:hypothetical protein